MSLQLKLTLLVLGLTTALLGGLGLALAGSLRGWAEEVVDAELARRVDVLANEAHVDHGRLELDDDDDLATRGLPFRIERQDGALLLGSDTWPAGSLTGLGYATVRSRGGGSVRVLSRAFTPQRGEPLVLRVAAPLSSIGDLTARFRDGLLLALAAAAVLSAAGAALLARGVFSPLRRLSAQVDALGPRSQAARLDAAGLDPALASLAAAFNGLLERLAAAAESQRGFIGRASHALRTPLSSILTETEVALRRERTVEEYRKTLGQVAETTRDAARLTDGLLALTRAESGQTAVREVVALDALAQDLARRFAARAEERGLTLTASAPAGLAVRAAPDRLREALDALLDNALRYTPRGGTVRFGAQQAGEGVLLEVADSGPGFSEGDRAHACERFFRGSAAASSGQPGSGLGLSLAKALAEAEGAALLLSASPEGGAAVHLRFPRAAAHGQ